MARIPMQAWVYFEYVRKVNGVGSGQGIMSMRCFEDLQQFFQVENGEELDYILEVWRRPSVLDGTGVGVWRVDVRLLLRYERREHFNDGRPRRTVLFRSPLHLLSRPRLYPREALPPLIESEADAVGVFPWALPLEDAFTGLVGGDTARQMWEMVTRAAVTTPEPMAPIVIPVAVAGGISDHPISERYTILLEALQRASAASWYAWYRATGGNEFTTSPPGPAGIPYPVDFDLVWTGLAQWEFRVFVGGRGEDRRLGYSDSPLVLSPEKDNVIQPVRLLDRLEEETRQIVAGAGQGKLRDVIRLRNAVDEGGSPWNVIEGYWDSRQIDGFGARQKLSRCDQTGLPGTQLRFKVDKEGAGAFSGTPVGVQVFFENGSLLPATVVVYVVNPAPDSDEVVVDFGFAIDCDFGGGVTEMRSNDVTSSKGLGDAVREGNDRLRTRGARLDTSVIMRQAGGMQYGRDFDLGDLMTFSFEGGATDRQVSRVRVILSDEESLIVDLAALDQLDRPVDEPLQGLIDDLIDAQLVAERNGRNI